MTKINIFQYMIDSTYMHSLVVYVKSKNISRQIIYIIYNILKKDNILKYLN